MRAAYTDLLEEIAGSEEFLKKVKESDASKALRDIARDLYGANIGEYIVSSIYAEGEFLKEKRARELEKILLASAQDM